MDARQIIHLTEHETTSLPAGQLSPAAGEYLFRHYELARRILTVDFPSVKNGHTWRLTPGNWVGQIVVPPNLRLNLQPKVPLHNLFQMLAYAHDLPSFDLSGPIAGCVSLVEFYDRLAYLLAERVLLRARQGLHHIYLSQEDRLPYLRGRLLIEKTSRVTLHPTLLCAYEEHTPDHPGNQLLYWTLSRLARSSLPREETRRLLQRATRTLQSLVSLLPPPVGGPAPVYSRLDQDYLPLHALCRFFLDSSGPSHHVGPDEMAPFLVDMPRLFEQFVAGWLAEHLPAGWQLRTQECLSIGKDRDLNLIADILLCDPTGRPRIVLDAKYKRTARVSPGDFSQVATYARALDCHVAGLLYPTPLLEPLDVWLDDLNIRSFAFNLDGALETSGQTFLETLRPILAL